jgi:hypothetical protein
MDVRFLSMSYMIWPAQVDIPMNTVCCFAMLSYCLCSTFQISLLNRALGPYDQSHSGIVEHIPVTAFEMEVEEVDQILTVTKDFVVVTVAVRSC